MPGPPRLGLSTTIQEQNQRILPISSVTLIYKSVDSIVIWIRNLLMDKTQILYAVTGGSRIWIPTNGRTRIRIIYIGQDRIRITILF